LAVLRLKTNSKLVGCSKGISPGFVPPQNEAPGANRGAIEVDLVPTQVDKLRGPQAVPVGQQDHRDVAMAVSIGLGCISKAVDLGIDQILAGAQFGVRPAQWRGNCSIYGGRNTSLRCDFAMFSALSFSDCSKKR
jgi:hypothetical protein